MCKLYIQNDLYLMDMYDIQNHELGMRRKKLLKLRQMGYDFPNNFRRNAISDDLHNEYDNKKNDELKLLNVEIKVSGRMMNRRIMGKSSFVTLQDMGGVIQLYIVDNMLQQGIYNYFKTWDVGDILGASGKLFKTRTGELSIYCREIYLLTKSLRPLPEKFHKLINQEIRYRKRYLDLIVNDESRNIFKIRSLMILEIRKFMVDHDFIEVETPMMQAIAGGANARPFTTHHNSLGMNMYLRISPELYLKRLVIGGFEKIFEINRNFRNEGISSLHNPEFTMMEIYVSYVDYRYLMFLLENLLCDLSNRVLGSSMLKYGNNTFDFSKPFTQMTMHEAIFHYYPEIKLHNINCLEDAVLTAKFFGIIVNKKWGLGKIQTVIFEKMVERYLVQPTFITQYPTEVSPLARPCDKNSFFSDRFELFISGYEIGNGFSELNDVDEQKIRFMNQLKYDDRGGNNDDIINSYDTDYLIALEHGLPPTAGVGIGIDRLVMLFTNQSSIRNVILFPTLRQKEK